MDDILSILIIDDNPDDWSLIVRLLKYEFPDARINQVLEEEGFNRALREADFDLVITDYKLKWSDGLKILRSVKERFPETPVVMFTDNGNEEIAVEAMKAGLDDYIVKSPTHFVRLAGAIQQVLKGEKRSKASKESETRYQKLFERVPIGLYRTALDGRILDANPALLRMLGYPDRESLFLVNAKELYVNPEDRKRERKMIERDRIVQGFETQLRRLDGKIIWVKDITYTVRDNDGKPLYYEGSLEDITEHKKDQKDLNLQETYFQQLFENSPEAITMVDKKDRIVRSNKCFQELFQYNSEEIEGIHINDLIVPDDLAEEASGISQKVLNGGVVQAETVRKRKDGSLVDVALLGYPMFVNDDLVGIYAIYKDITGRKEAEEALRESEEKYRILVEESHDAIYMHSGNKLQFVNYKICDITGYTKEELYQMEVWDIIHPEDRDRMKEIVKRKEKGERMPKTYEARLLTKDGGVKVAEFAVDKVKFKGEYAVLGTVRDITEYKEMEDEIQRAEKLETIGILAGGIAHDFNNLLTGIMGNLSLAKMHVATDDEAFKVLTEAEKASREAGKLTQQLLTFSKGGAPIKEAASITEIIKDSAEFALRGSNVRCDFHFPDDLWMVEVDRTQMSQVINNLIINADQAMPEGGIIKVSASNITISEDSVLPIGPGQYVEILMEDEGVGIPEEHLLNIFDPFFTTKEGGSGLGLATVYSIIQRHSGYITCESEVESGSTFYIYLPASVKGIEKEEMEERLESSKGGVKVLLMDDEEVIRDVAGRMLDRLGYKVEFASSGEEVIDIYKQAFQSGDCFDIVIMDLTVPGGMGGKEAIEKLLKIDPDIKAIVSSGYFNDPVMANFKDYGFSGVVPKPYDIDELGKAVKEVIEGGNEQK